MFTDKKTEQNMMNCIGYSVLNQITICGKGVQVMKTRNKKAFTVVELVIVIAIIAILAAILIPTFASLVKKANVSADTQLIRNLNTALASDSAANNNKPHPTMTDALKAAEDFGYDVGKINKSATDNEILWDSANDLFCYYDASTNKVRYIPESETKITKTLTADSCEYWCIISVEATDTSVTVDCGKEDMNWSVFLKDCSAKTINAKTGVDVGWINTVESINYVRTSTDQPSEQLVKIRSYGGEVTVNAPNDTVEHYGFATVLNCEDVKVGTFREFGTVGRLIYTDDNGKIEFGSTAVVYCYMNASDDAGQNFESVLIDEGAIVYTTIANTVPDTDDSDPNNIARFKDTVHPGIGVVVKGHLVDINQCYNHNSDYDLIKIGDDIYVICKCCGGFTKYVPGENGEYVADNDVSNVKVGTTDNPVENQFSYNPATNSSECTNHDLIHIDRDDPNCFDKDGKEAHYKCNICGKLFTDSEGQFETNDDELKIPFGHDLVGTYCNRCGHPVAFIDESNIYTITDERNQNNDDSDDRLMPVVLDILKTNWNDLDPIGTVYMDVAYSFKAFQTITVNNESVLDEKCIENDSTKLYDYDEKANKLVYAGADGKYSANEKLYKYDAQTNKIVFVGPGGEYSANDIYELFKGWICDYYVAFDRPVKPYSCGLGGYYEDWGALGFLAPKLNDKLNDDGYIKANTLIPLIGTLAKIEVSYEFIVNNVKEFVCGFFNFSEQNVGAKFTVYLRMYKPKTGDELSDPLVAKLGDYVDVAVTDYTVKSISDKNKALVMQLKSQINQNQEFYTYLKNSYPEVLEILEEIGE